MAGMSEIGFWPKPTLAKE